MKTMKFFAIAAMAMFIMSCGNKSASDVVEKGKEAVEAVTGAVDMSKVEDVYNKAMSGELSAADLSIAVEQAKAIMGSLKGKFSAEDIKKAENGPLDAKEAFYGDEYDNYKAMNQMFNALSGQEDKMDDATKAAYTELQAERQEVLGY